MTVAVKFKRYAKACMSSCNHNKAVSSWNSMQRRQIVQCHVCIDKQQGTCCFRTKKSLMCVLCRCCANVIPKLQLKNTGNDILDDKYLTDVHLQQKRSFQWWKATLNSHTERQAQRKFEEEEILLALYSKEYTAGTRIISAHPKFPVMRVRNTL